MKPNQSNQRTNLMTGSWMLPSLMLVVVLVGPNYPGAAQDVSKDLVQETLMAQKAATPPLAQEAITPLITKDLTGISRRGSSDVHRRLSAGLFEPCPPPQCASVCLRAGGLRRDAGEGATRTHAAARPNLL